MTTSATPKFIVDPDAEEYIRAVVAATTGEVGGWFYSKKNDDGNFYIYKYVVLPQEASHASVDFDDEGQHAELARAMEDGEIDNLRGSWHSHGSMGVYFSTTDEEAIRKYQKTGAPYLLSLVYNRKGDVKTRLDMFDSAAMDRVYMEDLDYEVDNPEVESEIAKQAAEDVKSNVRTATTRYSGGYTPNGKKGKDWRKAPEWDDDGGILWENRPAQKQFRNTKLAKLDEKDWRDFVYMQYGSELKDLEAWGAKVGVKDDGTSYIVFPILGSDFAEDETEKPKKSGKRGSKK